MIDVVSIKFKSCGKVYYFAPNGNDPKAGERVVVETANGRELAICSQGVHAVADDRVVQPLQPVLRVATPADLRVVELNKKGLRIACGGGSILEIRQLQAEGGKRMAAPDYFRGHPLEG